MQTLKKKIANPAIVKLKNNWKYQGLKNTINLIKVFFNLEKYDKTFYSQQHLKAYQNISQNRDQWL